MIVQEQEREQERVERAPQAAVIACGRQAGDTLWVLGMLHRTLVSGRDTNGRLAVIDARCGQWQGTPPHIHHTEDETFFVYEGMFEFLAGDETFVAVPGSLVHIPMGMIHCYRAVGEGTNRMTLSISPAGFEAFFTAIGDPVIPGFPVPHVTPDKAAYMMAIAPRYNLEFVSPSDEN